MKMLPIMLIVTLLAGFLIWDAGILHAEEGDLVAQVGLSQVTEFDLAREVSRLLPRRAGIHGGVAEEKVAELRQEALETLLERACLTQYAIDEQYRVSSFKVDEIYNDVRRQFPSAEAFRAYLGGESLVEFRGSIYRRLLAEEVERRFIEERARVDDAEVAQHYRDNREKFKRPPQYRVSLIYIKVDPALPAEDRENLRKKAEDLLDRAKAGEDFHDLAYFNSDDKTSYVGGDIGFFHAGQMRDKDLEQAIAAMQVGEIQLLRNLFGYHIIKMTDRRAATQLTLEDVADGIRQSLEEERREALRQELVEAIKKSYPVQVYGKT